MKNIKHIVHLMLENRSLDNVLGWLYEHDTPLHYIPSTNKKNFNGLQTGNYSNPDGKGGTIPVTRITKEQGQKIPSVDPHEEFQHVQVQIAKSMQGFYKDFIDCGSKNPKEIMACYTPESLPIINHLAKNFAVSDAYFSSIPTQTNCNRAFSLTGNSIGWWSHVSSETGARVNNEWTTKLDPFEFTEKTLWNFLSDHGYTSPDDWSVFYNQTWPGVGPYQGSYCYTQDLFWSSLKKYSANFRRFDEFMESAANGSLPKFSYLEPTWYEEKYGIGHNGSDYHPPANVGAGEIFLSNIYKSLKASPKWKNTLLIINFDEHGGTYDHVKPPRAIAPWADPNHGTKEPQKKECNFDFKQFGVRVPLILVSPLIEKQTVFRSSTNIPFDHTSVIATILNHFRIPKTKWKLGSRTANAPTFENVVTLDTPRAINSLPDPIELDNSTHTNATPNDFQIMLMKRMFSRHIQRNKLPEKECDTLFMSSFKNIEKMKMTDINIEISTFLDNLNSLKK